MAQNSTARRHAKPGASADTDAQLPPKPTYRFAGELPAALAYLRDERRWVAWKYVLKQNDTKWTKPPINPHTGKFGSSTDPKAWGTFDEALAAVKRYRLAGVGLVLTGDDGMVGGDLDHCVNDAGMLTSLAAAIVGLAETYAEYSPSAEGLRFLLTGKLVKALKNDAVGAEVYSTGRYLTITGNKVDEAPDEIRDAPQTLALLSAAARPKKASAAADGRTTCRPKSDEAERIREALRHIPADARETWLRMGMAVKSQLGDAGFGLWREWALSSVKWEEVDGRRVWHSIKPEGGITIATLFGLARENGWVEAKPAEKLRDEVDRAAPLRKQPHWAQVTRSLGSAKSAARQLDDEDAPGGPVDGDQPTLAEAMSPTDFYAHMPSGDYIFADNGDLWPAKSVDARIRPIETYESGDGGKPVRLKASAWIAQQRAVEQMTWAPGRPQLIRDALVLEGGLVDRRGCHVFNLYRPPTIKRGDAKKAGMWLDHVKMVYPDNHHHIINWLAQRVQRPQEKINHALVLGGAPRIGKDTLLHPVFEAIGPWNKQEIGPSMLMGSFNQFAQAVILRVNEAHDQGEFDRYALYERSKTLIAAPPDVLSVNEKHRRPYAIPNVVGVIYTTNHRTASLYLPANDGRHFVVWSELTKEDCAPSYWDDLWGWYKNGGCRHVAAYLAALDLSQFDPKAPPAKTPAFWAIVHTDRAPEEGELADVIDELGKPVALCLYHLENAAENSAPKLAERLKDRSKARAIPHSLERAGYVRVDSDTKDGYWAFKAAGRNRHAVYVHQSLRTVETRMQAASTLANARGLLSELAIWAAAKGWTRTPDAEG